MEVHKGQLLQFHCCFVSTAKTATK